MSIAYVKVKRTINVGASPGEKFLARIVREQPVELDLIAEQIAGASTMSKADGRAIEVQTIFACGARLLAYSALSPSLRAKAVATVDEVTVNSIRGLYIIARPRRQSRTWHRLATDNQGLQSMRHRSLYGEDGEPDSNVTRTAKNTTSIVLFVENILIHYHKQNGTMYSFHAERGRHWT